MKTATNLSFGIVIHTLCQLLVIEVARPATQVLRAFAYRMLVSGLYLRYQRAAYMGRSATHKTYPCVWESFTPVRGTGGPCFLVGETMLPLFDRAVFDPKNLQSQQFVEVTTSTWSGYQQKVSALSSCMSLCGSACYQ